MISVTILGSLLLATSAGLAFAQGGGAGGGGAGGGGSTMGSGC